jgi:hypothetical protein
LRTGDVEILSFPRDAGRGAKPRRKSSSSEDPVRERMMMVGRDLVESSETDRFESSESLETARRALRQPTPLRLAWPGTGSGSCRADAEDRAVATDASSPPPVLAAEPRTACSLRVRRRLRRPDWLSFETSPVPWW